jgi:hypothetical protein
MKNEDKIVELLSEYLKKHDALEGKFVDFVDKTNQTLQFHSILLEQMVKGQDQLVKGQGETNQAITRLANSMSSIVELQLINQSNYEQRLRALEEKLR